VITPGVCSVTLRSMSIDEVAALAAECGLGAIEWGADVHVRPGDDAAVRRARAASSEFQVSYGSYLFAAPREASDHPADRNELTVATLDTAVQLGAQVVRVWCPFGVEPGASRASAVADELRTIAEAARERALNLALEFHGGTLTATVASTIALLDEVNEPNVSTYWQPPYWLPERDPKVDVDDVLALGARLSNVHVYEWTHAPQVERRPLDAGRDRWHSVLQAMPPEPRCALLEFVADDDPDQLRRDARTLIDVLDEIGGMVA
jgi:sugar phosphate isomerase/epimerase